MTTLLRLSITFTEQERDALQIMSEEHLRPPQEQTRWCVREEAKRQNVWSDLERQKASEKIEGANKSPIGRLRITLEQPVYSALLKMASQDLRPPELQAEHIIREAIKPFLTEG